MFFNSIFPPREVQNNIYTVIYLITERGDEFARQTDIYIYRYIYVCITTPCETFPCGKLTEKEKHHVWE